MKTIPYQQTNADANMEVGATGVMPISNERHLFRGGTRAYDMIPETITVAKEMNMKYTFAVGALAGLSTVLAAGNVQTFTGNLGGAAPPVIENDASDRPFSVNGATFLNKGAALQRSCAVQHNACASAANGGKADISVADCDQQEDACNAAAATKVRARAADFGSCANPAIEFAPQNDRGGADAFAAVDQNDFNHGSANNINVISGFICQRLADSCKASQDTTAACDDAQAAADGLSGQAAADAFNNALGVSA
ncbi:hypothetical protein J7T55_010639 [Diaporthe amygdali]|uniref:uncharacterized protein n=1 Tax=Phomopsis amygdali TaxID=1214568 RepID=UPI0022FEA85A|nr:uncharacterized protein J7T55_010639 [Diaporthe amygdali]KAJ0114252.1 hypothetical protein J7T55_010639 [Diaporthe amygdali]